MEQVQWTCPSHSGGPHGTALCKTRTGLDRTRPVRVVTIKSYNDNFSSFSGWGVGAEILSLSHVSARCEFCAELQDAFERDVR